MLNYSHFSIVLLQLEKIYKKILKVYGGNL